ncbi:DUF6188 family protein [Rhodococcus sp. P1Y]|uniref:DUF6188 family protein n=1 Tax=Rhodococcus sp. P1Y TaxID=1302308 RepID=UPI0012940120|nr:DUF6188 family protein [Rhodococcus sp. P1Y]
MQLGLDGQRLARVLVDFDLYLEFESGDTIALSDFSINGPRDSATGALNVGFGNIAQGLAALLQLIGTTCAAAETNDSGDLTVIFVDGTKISAPHSDGEAWEFSGSDGRHIISGPEGDLSTWAMK